LQVILQKQQNIKTMKDQLYPCLWFDGKAKEAAMYYTSVFDDSKINSENLLVVMFNLEGVKFMGLNGGPNFKINPSISFFVYCQSAQEVEKKWSQLSEGGSVMMPLNTYPWNKKYGWCQDKFGVNWQLMASTGSEQKIVPSFMFTQQNAGKAEEAMNFYTSVFKNAEVKMISRYEKGEGDVEGYIKHAQFKLNGQAFIAMESTGSHAFTFNEGISLVVPCDDQQEIDYYWNKLTEGGKESQCGWLKDKFGVSWQVVPASLGKLMSNPDKRERVMKVVMKSVKFNMEELENA
jgi:predicted 3-demethylubiquinone-9 3-methyltransferase (glyoxalase superfamily)